MRSQFGVFPALRARSRAFTVVASALAVALAASPLMPASAAAQDAVTPYFMVVFDTSGSMTGSTGSGNNSCGQPRTRINDAKCVLQRVVNGYGDVTFGLERFTQTCSGSCSSCSCSGSCTSTASSGQVLVPIRPDNQADILSWVDYSCSNCSSTVASQNPELRASGQTPLGGALLAARAYFTGASSPLIGDSYGTCRPVSVILLTDGDETCGGNARNAATLLRSTVVGGLTYDIRTYVIGFGISAGDSDIEGIAQSGGTDAPGAHRGFYASDETSLALAFSQIIADSIRYEVCDGVDNDCDTRVDEGFTLYCDRPRGVTTAQLCADPGERNCDGLDDNCNGQVDEGLLNACGTCGPAPVEVCDTVDNDCDGAIDEGVCGGCTPSAEICDGIDNDCDGVIDNITRPCGTDVGQCTTGTQLCTTGTWGPCSGRGPVPEICNGLDDDCNGVIDGQVEFCGSDVGVCQRGSRICTAGSYGPCIGSIEPGTELCNGLDDDCDGRLDENNPGGGGACGSTVGACRGGTLQCMGGMLVCTGGISPGMETCNGLDDDCDGRVDEGNPGGGATCGMTDVGECSLGREQCVSGALACVGARGPRPELCNGLDDDCDGSVDEGDPEAGDACGDDTGECVAGTTRCIGGALVCAGAVGPTPELCNGLDDDCDGVVDDEIPIGAACGTDVGECIPGVYVCDPVTGTLVCNGEVGPSPETCNVLDDDCDARVDEALADVGPCGTDVGACMAGTIRCVDGLELCVGEVGPSPEVCDCEDNDCDGETDEPPSSGSLCPTGSACVECQCARECVPSEFGFDCPTGRTPRVGDDGVCHCVAPRCDATTCAAETIEVDGVVLCGPDDDGAAPCVCRNNECTFACDGVVCTEGLVCNPRDPAGRCVEDNCRGLGCAPDQICDRATGDCVSDPCATVSCAAGEACRAGTCEPSCADAQCASGQLCRAGECVTDRCAGAGCGAGEVCDPASGDCVIDRCIGVPCPNGTICIATSGECRADPCDTLRCPSGQRCVRGECESTGGGRDGGVGFDAGAGPDGSNAILVQSAGGGGCLCRAAGAGGAESGSSRGALAIVSLLALALASRPRRRRGRGARGCGGVR